MRTLGATVRGEMTGIAAHWKTMRPAYQAPAQERMLALMEAPADDARALHTTLRSAAALLDSYAAEIRLIQLDLADLEYRANAFRLRVQDGVSVPVSRTAQPSLTEAVGGFIGMAEPWVTVPWDEDTETVAENEALLAEHGVILSRLTVAADECENGLHALITEGTEHTDTGPIPPDAFDSPRVEMPWGYPRQERLSGIEQIGPGLVQIGQELFAMLAMVGIDGTGRPSPLVAANAWAGAANLFGSALISAAYPPDKMRLFPPMWHGWLRNRYDAAAPLGLAVGYDAAAAEHGVSPWHAWEDRPITTGMVTVFNVATIWAPSRAGASAARLSARGARLARAADHAADFLVPGGSYLTTGGVRVTTHLADAARSRHIDGAQINPRAVIDGGGAAESPVSDEVFGRGADRPPDTPGAGSGGAHEAPSADGGGRVPPDDGGGTAPPGNGGGSGGGNVDPPPLPGDDGFINGEMYSDRYPGVVSSVRPIYPDLELAPTYESGDVARPGNHPPTTPTESLGVDGADHGWQGIRRPLHRESFQYQMQVTGIRPDPNGVLPEYVRTGSSGEQISYDGLTYRGGQDVYIEVKRGFDELAFGPLSEAMQAKLDGFVAQAAKQAEALPEGTLLEWHVSDRHGAAAIRARFDSDPDLAEFEILVVHTPRLVP